MSDAMFRLQDQSELQATPFLLYYPTQALFVIQLQVDLIMLLYTVVFVLGFVSTVAADACCTFGCSGPFTSCWDCESQRCGACYSCLPTFRSIVEDASADKIAEAGMCGTSNSLSIFTYSQFCRSGADSQLLKLLLGNRSCVDEMLSGRLGESWTLAWSLPSSLTIGIGLDEPNSITFAST